MTTPRILFVSNMSSRFIQIDRDILAARWPVDDWYEPERRMVPNLSGLVRALRSVSLIYGFFAFRHTLWPVLLGRLMGKPAVLAVGGYDVARMPEIGYGSQQGGPAALATRLAMWNARRLLAISNFARTEAISNGRVNPTAIEVVYLGVEPVLPAGPPPVRQDMILTVGNVKRSNFWRKGLLPFVRAARLLPDLRFVVAGSHADDSIHDLRAEAPPNVEFLGRVSDERLAELYATAKVYVQASMHEGFGMTVAEAMRAGCIPVVTRAGALPEVVGEAGVYADSNTPEAVADAICTALKCDVGAHERASARIQARFPVEARRDALHRVVAELIES